MCAHNCICRDDQLGLTFGRFDSHGVFVDIEGFLLGSFENVFEGSEGFRFVFWESGWHDFQVRQANLLWGLVVILRLSWCCGMASFEAHG